MNPPMVSASRPGVPTAGTFSRNSRPSGMKYMFAAPFQADANAYAIGDPVASAGSADVRPKICFDFAFILSNSESS